MRSTRFSTDPAARRSFLVHSTYLRPVQLIVGRFVADDLTLILALAPTSALARFCTFDPVLVSL